MTNIIGSLLLERMILFNVGFSSGRLAAVDEYLSGLFPATPIWIVTSVAR